MRRAIAVFAKAPVPGEVKTRLIGALGAERAARLHAQLTAATLQRALSVPATDVQFWIDGPAAHPFVVESSRKFRIDVTMQVGNDLGEKMSHALQSLLKQAERALIVGTDCPAQRREDLIDAFALLDNADAVVQPAEDGGYVLVGCKRNVPPLFGDIDWGTDRVLQQTRQRAHSVGAVLAELPTVWDLDRPADFERALQLQLIERP